MTPKEKAKELVDNYDETLPYLKSKSKAKQCALIAVEEILNAITFNMYDEDAYNKEDKYWCEVKQEIEKL